MTKKQHPAGPPPFGDDRHEAEEDLTSPLHAATAGNNPDMLAAKQTGGTTTGENRVTLEESVASIAKTLQRVVAKDHDDPKRYSLADMPGITSTERSVTLRRAGEVNPETNSLWMGVALHTDAISYASYERFIENVLCADPQTSELIPPELESTAEGRARMVTRQAALRHLPGSEMYELLKTATEAFLLLYCGVYPDARDMAAFTAVPPVPADQDAAGGLLIGGGAATPLSSDMTRSDEKLTIGDLRKKLGAYLGNTRNNYQI
ncbi:MAG: hypothetical protein KY444_10305, partial [Gemmatimonadetes bacterium]|nr:hypothetical protein [Gemmatimonadota bacterium]